MDNFMQININAIQINRFNSFFMSRDIPENVILSWKLHFNAIFCLFSMFYRDHYEINQIPLIMCHKRKTGIYPLTLTKAPIMF